MKSRDLGLCLIVLAIWSSSSSLVARFMQSCNAIIVAGIVVSISFFVSSLQLIIKKRRNLIFSFHFNDCCKLLLPATLGLFLYPMFYFFGIGGSSPIKANILNYLWPLVAYLSSCFFFKKKMKPVELCAVIIATIGGYIVMCSTDAFDINGVSFEWSTYKYMLLSLLGAVSYGIYTAIIEHFTPKIRQDSAFYNSSACPENIMPASVRIYLMVFISFLLFIPVLFSFLIFNRSAIVNTFSHLTSNITTFFALLFYSIINYTLAHFLWNKVNVGNNVSTTSSMAFLIPLLSTVVLSYTSGVSIGLAPSIGLTLIVASIIINNRKHLNSINCTFVGVIVLAMLISFTPVYDKNEELELARYFLEIIIALYSIYYGFVMNRVIADYKEFETLVDKISRYKTRLSEIELSNVEELEKRIVASKKPSKKKEYLELGFELSNFFCENRMDEDFENNYYLLYRCSDHALESSEWLIIIILSVLIIFLSFIVRNGGLLSTIVVVAIGSTICLCVSSLYEYELKKTEMLKRL